MSKIIRVILWGVASLACLLEVDFLYSNYRLASQPVATIAERLRPNAKRDMVVKATYRDRQQDGRSWVTIYDLLLYNQSDFHCYDTLKVKLGYIDQYNGELSALERIVTVYRTIQPGDSLRMKGVRSGLTTDKDFLDIDGGLVEIVN